jgi:hypothetical protein
MKVDHKISLHDCGDVRVIRPREISMSPVFYLLYNNNNNTSGLGSHYQGFTIILRHTTLVRTPLDEWPARRTDLYLTTRNTHKRHPYPSGIRTRNLCNRATANPCLRLRCIGNRQSVSNAEGTLDPHRFEGCNDIEIRLLWRLIMDKNVYKMGKGKLVERCDKILICRGECVKKRENSSPFLLKQKINSANYM